MRGITKDVEEAETNLVTYNTGTGMSVAQDGQRSRPLQLAHFYSFLCAVQGEGEGSSPGTVMKECRNAQV